MGLTRDKSRKKVGLALGTGAARGLAHIGVIEALEKEGIPIDMIAGTSIGALVGAIYAHGKDIEKLKNLAITLGAKRLSLVDLTLPKTGLFRGRKIEDTLKSVVDEAKFSDLKIPFACVATDIDCGEEVVFKEGLVWKAIRASISIPVILDVVKLGGKFLVDGTLVNPVPVSVVRGMGADIVIAVNVVPHREITGKTAPNIFAVIMQTIYISSYKIIKASLAGADIVIEPDISNIGYADFHHARECILRGEMAAREAIPKIKNAMQHSSRLFRMVE